MRPSWDGQTIRCRILGQILVIFGQIFLHFFFPGSLCGHQKLPFLTIPFIQNLVGRIYGFLFSTKQAPKVCLPIFDEILGIFGPKFLPGLFTVVRSCVPKITLFRGAVHSKKLARHLTKLQGS
jgi:hypothetical protein